MPVWKFTNFKITLLWELEFHKIMESLSVANFYTRSSPWPIGLKTERVVMFGISPTLFLSVTSSVCRDNQNCLYLHFPPWLLLHCKFWVVSNAWNSIFPADIHLPWINFLIHRIYHNLLQKNFCMR